MSLYAVILAIVSILFANVAEAQAQAGPAGATLQQGWLWIRTVTGSADFHRYLQTSKESSLAVMGDYHTAGQFKIEGGQFQQYIPKGKNVFLNINGTKDLGGNALPTFFSTEPNKVGRFTFSGDAVIWHDDRGQFLKDKKDQNAWLVCVKNNFRLYINLRYYSDPSTGCNSHTIHFYNDKTARGPTN